MSIIGTVLVEKGRENQRVYNTVLVKPESLNVFSNGLPMKIVRELGKQPQCAMDLARKLKEHEQNVYYHLKRLKNAGLIRLLNEENRAGMTAKIYELVSPVVAAKLHEDGYRLEEARIDTTDPAIAQFFDPFIKNGKLNAKIIFGDPYPHGEYDAVAKDGLYTFDLAMMFGKIVKNLKFLSYVLDTEIKKEDLNENLILIGNAKTNVLIHKINDMLPVYFDKDTGWAITSRSSKNIYDDPRIGIVVKCDSPFNPRKKILIVGGNGTRGTKAGIIALTQHVDELKDIIDGGKTGVIVEGVDKDGDMVIDSARIVE